MNIIAGLSASKEGPKAAAALGALRIRGWNAVAVSNMLTRSRTRAALLNHPQDEARAVLTLNVE